MPLGDSDLRNACAYRTLGRFGHFFGFLSADDTGHVMWGGKQAVRKTTFLDDWIRFNLRSP